MNDEITSREITGFENHRDTQEWVIDTVNDFREKEWSVYHISKKQDIILLSREFGEEISITVESKEI